MSALAHHVAPWRWLAGIFAAPLNPAELDACRAGIASSLEVSDDPAVAGGLRMMRAALDAIGTDGAASLARTYTVLFSGAGGRVAVAPYESAFATASGRLFGEPEGRMRALLSELELSVAESFAEAADHIAVEFAVMAELPAGSTRRGELARHLEVWLGDFREACAARDESGFYTGAATVAAALARDEALETIKLNDISSTGGAQ
jgi:TorA maturation chaperone TorD